METKVIKLMFTTPVHFGKNRLSDANESFLADTFFSGLCIEAVALGKLEILLELIERGELRFSDSFPYVGEDYFLPKPMLKMEQTNPGIDLKELKKMNFIQIKAIKDYFDGKICPKEQRKSLKLGQSQVRTNVNLQGKESEPYNVGLFQFCEQAGLYVIVQASEQAEKLLDTLLNSLQYSGIGGKRNSGFGRFTYEIKENAEISSLLSTKGTTKILLSTAMCEEEKLETVLAEAHYLLQKRSGFVQSATFSDELVKKKDFFTFKAGSTFKKSFDGVVKEVGEKGNHPVYRYAKTLFWEVTL